MDQSFLCFEHQMFSFSLHKKVSLFLTDKYIGSSHDYLVKSTNNETARPE